MTGADVWRIVVDIYSFQWVPGWVWIVLASAFGLSVIVGLAVGPYLRWNRRRYYPRVSPVHANGESVGD